MSTDARVSAWIAARLLIDAAGRFRMDDAKRKPSQRVTEQPWQIVQMLEEAELLTRLTGADVSVGLAAGVWLDKWAESRAEDEERSWFTHEFVKLTFEPEGEK